MLSALGLKRRGLFRWLGWQRWSKERVGGKEVQLEM